MLEVMVINPFGKTYLECMEAMVVEVVHHYNRGLDPSWDVNRRAFLEEKLDDVKTRAILL